MAILAARAIGIDVEQDFAEYFTARAVPLRRLAYALCGDWYLAEDLVQNTFSGHWESAGIDRHGKGDRNALDRRTS